MSNGTERPMCPMCDEYVIDPKKLHAIDNYDTLLAHARAMAGQIESEEATYGRNISLDLSDAAEAFRQFDKDQENG